MARILRELIELAECGEDAELVAALHDALGDGVAGAALKCNGVADEEAWNEGTRGPGPGLSSRGAGDTAGLAAPPRRACYVLSGSQEEQP